MRRRDQIIKLRGALLTLLSDIDYRKGNCRLNEQIGALVNPGTWHVVDEALEATKPQ